MQKKNIQKQEHSDRNLPFINPYMTNELAHHFLLSESVFNFRGMFIPFFAEFPLSKQNCQRWDAAFCDFTNLGYIVCLRPIKGCQAFIIAPAFSRVRYRSPNFCPSVRSFVRAFGRPSVRPSTFTSKFGFLDIRDSCESETLHSNCP